MLQSATVHPATLAILKKIMRMPVFKPFNLVGGTALSLQICVIKLLKRGGARKGGVLSKQY